MSTFGFIGLGNMGLGMASNLAKAGHEVIGFDLSKKTQKAARKAGCKIAKSVNEAVKDSDAVIMMLKDLRLEQDAAQSARAATPLGAQAMALYALMESAGQDGLDFSGVMKLINGSI